MNNSKIIESFKSEPEEQEITPADKIPWMRQREGELVTIIDALRTVEQTKEWSTLKTEVFDGVVEILERKMKQEASKMPLDDKAIYQLQGQLVWARKYTNLDSLAQVYRTELTNIRLQLKNGN